MSSKVISPEVISWISQHRTAPIGKLWALPRHVPSDLPVGTAEFSGLVVSRQLARELRWPKPDSYPNWPDYPVTHESGPHACIVCGKAHLTASKPRHTDWANPTNPPNPTVSQSDKPNPTASQPDANPTRCEVCNKPLRPRAHTGGRAQRFCSEACEAAARRKRASRT